MKLSEVLKVLMLPKWSDKNISDAARGFANAGCNDKPDVELKAFLDIAHDNYMSGHWGFWTYSCYCVGEIIRELST